MDSLSYTDLHENFKAGHARKHAQKARHRAANKPARVYMREEALADAADPVPDQDRDYELELPQSSRSSKTNKNSLKHVQDSINNTTITTITTDSANTTTTTTTTTTTNDNNAAQPRPIWPPGEPFQFTGRQFLDAAQYNLLKQSGQWTALGVACVIADERPEMTAEEIVKYIDKLEGPQSKRGTSSKKVVEAVKEEMFKKEYYVDYVSPMGGEHWWDLRNRQI